jgi:hypothetical protein
MTEIEQIKQERDQAIAAALKLRDAVAEHIGGETYPNEIALAVKDVEAIAPKRECKTCHGLRMIPDDSPNGDVMNTPCSCCNPRAVSA